jgi:hypothetical protein
MIYFRIIRIKRILSNGEHRGLVGVGHEETDAKGIKTTSTFACVFVMILEGNLHRGRNQYHGTYYTVSDMLDLQQFNVINVPFVFYQ